MQVVDTTNVQKWEKSFSHAVIPLVTKNQNYQILKAESKFNQNSLYLDNTTLYIICIEWFYIIAVGYIGVMFQMQYLQVLFEAACFSEHFDPSYKKIG